MPLPIPENADEYMQCIHCEYISWKATHLTDPACPSCGKRGIWSSDVDWSARDRAIAELADQAQKLDFGY